MEIAQVSEIYLNDPESSTDAAPSSVIVNSYMGVAGNRGTYVIPGLGNPTVYDFENAFIIGVDGQPQFITPQPFDWFINLKPSDPDYLTVYQLDKNGENWSRVLKLTPNNYSTNFVGTFVAGQNVATVTVPKLALVLEQLFGNFNDISNFSVKRIPTVLETVNSVSSESAMLSISPATVGQYAFRTDISQFFRLVAADASIIDNWQAELSLNFDIDIESIFPATPYPVAIGFELGAAAATETDYVFPFLITAAELQPLPTGFTPVSGDRIIHVTINVI
jgi:hypothetical protein